MMRATRSLLLVLVLSGVSQSALADLIIDVNYTGDPQYAAAFTSAAQTWQSLLVGYQSGLVASTPYAGSSYSVGQTVSTVFIDATISAIDGAGGVLGSAGPTSIIFDAEKFWLATDGQMQFDSADVANLFSQGRWESVILHEMGHVLGFGTLWGSNNVYDGLGNFTGEHATAVWQTEFGQTGNPDVELGGGGGTAHNHWNEVDGGGGLTGITDGLGRDMRNEVMTGWIGSSTFISNLTVASFVDIGFLGAQATPEPASCVLASLGLGGLALRRRRQKKQAATAA